MLYISKKIRSDKMPIINSIPEKYQSGFEELAKLNDEDFNKIQQSLEQIPFVSSIDNLMMKIYQLTKVEIDLEDIFSSVGSLISFIENKDAIVEIANDIAKLSLDYDFIKDEDKENFISRLIILLNGKQIYYAYKAEDLLNNYGNSFITSRIISDIRPVFELDLDEELKAGMILHNLTIHYQSNDEPFHKNISLTLTPSNIQELKEVLDRAELKEEKLQSILKISKMVDLNE